jgi:hypothetical protein
MTSGLTFMVFVDTPPGIFKRYVFEFCRLLRRSDFSVELSTFAINLGDLDSLIL